LILDDFDEILLWPRSCSAYTAPHCVSPEMTRLLQSVI